MPVNFSNYPLARYLDQLASKEPVPGGGSAAAFAGAMGAGLLSMVANYSIGRKANTNAIEAKLIRTKKASEAIRRRLLELTSLDSRVYLRVAAARKKDARTQKAASLEAAKVGKEICRLCYQAMTLAPFLIEHGNPYLFSDIEVAVELLEAGFEGSLVMVKVNQ